MAKTENRQDNTAQDLSFQIWAQELKQKKNSKKKYRTEEKWSMFVSFVRCMRPKGVMLKKKNIFKYLTWPGRQSANYLFAFVRPDSQLFGHLVIYLLTYLA